jgi:hypothetical protein
MFEFNTRQFEFSHGRAPKGRGSWAFAVRDLGGEPIFTPSMTYAEAKMWIKNHVRPQVPAEFVGTVTIHVLP